MTSLALRALHTLESAAFGLGSVDDGILLWILVWPIVLALAYGQNFAPPRATLGTAAKVLRSLVWPQGRPGVLAHGHLAAQIAREAPAREAPAQEAAAPAPAAIPPPEPPPAPAPAPAPPPPDSAPAAAPPPAPQRSPLDTADDRPPVSFWVLGNYCYVRPKQRIADDALFWRYKAKMEELGGFFLPPDLSFEFPVQRGLAVQDALVALGLRVVLATEDKLPVAFAGRASLVRLYAYLRYLAGVDPQGRVVVAYGSRYIATAMSRGRKVAMQDEAQRMGLSTGPKVKGVDGGYVRSGLRALSDLGYVQFEGPDHARTYVLPAVAPTSQPPAPDAAPIEPTPPTVDPASDPPRAGVASGRINRSAEGGSTDPRRADQPIRLSSDHDHHRHDHLDDRGFGPSPGGGPPTPVAAPTASGAPPPSGAPPIHLALVAPQGKAPEPLPDELTGLGLESVVVRFHGQGSDVLRRVITAARRVKWKMAQGVPIRNFPGAVTSAFLHPQDWDVPAEALRDPAPPRARGSDLVAIQPAIQPPIPDEPEPALEPAPEAPPLWRAVVKALAPAAEGASPIAMWASMAHCTSAEGGVFRLRGDQFLRDQLRRPEVRAVVDRALAAAGAAGGRIEWEDSHA